MARQMSATRRDGLATFLLEMALDKARMKARLASVLLEERQQRGHGDARRFPQPAMAALLGYSLRQYQRLEDPDEGSLPLWEDLTQILAKLGRPDSDIFGEDADAADPAESLELEPSPNPNTPNPDLAEELAALGAKIDRILALLEPPDAPADQGSATKPPA
jgi:hypothetical protein